MIFLKCGVELTGRPVEFFTAFLNEMDMQAILGHLIEGNSQESARFY